MSETKCPFESDASETCSFETRLQQLGAGPQTLTADQQQTQEHTVEPDSF